MDDELYKKLKKELEHAFDTGAKGIRNFPSYDERVPQLMMGLAQTAEALIKLEQASKKKKPSPIKSAL